MFYSETETKFSGDFVASRFDATAMYLQHFDNLLTIEFMIKNTKDRKERCDLEKQREIANRKMKFWTHQGNFNHDEMLVGVANLKKKWK